MIELQDYDIQKHMKVRWQLLANEKMHHLVESGHLTGFLKFSWKWRSRGKQEIGD
jgi:hypothetical protein